MAITITVDNDRVAAGIQNLFEDESGGTQTSGTTDTGNEIDVTLSNPVGGTLGGFVTAFNDLLNNSGGVLATKFGAGLALTDAQRVFAAAKDGAASSADFVKVTASNGEVVSDLFFSDPAGAPLDGDQVFISAGVPLQTLSGDNIYLWSSGDFAIATTSSSAGAGRIVAAFYLNDTDPNHLQAAVQMVTFEALKHPDATSADDAVNFTNILQVSAAGSQSFDFDALKSSGALWVAVGNNQTAIVVSGYSLDVNAEGKLENTSNKIAVSQGGTGTTIGLNNQLFDNVGERAVFTLVNGLDSLTSADGGILSDYIVDHTGPAAEGLNYTGYINVIGAGIFLSQSQGTPTETKDFDIDLYHAGGAGNVPEVGFNYIGAEPSGAFLDDTPVNAATVTIRDDDGNLVATWVAGADPDGAGPLLGSGATIHHVSTASGAPGNNVTVTITGSNIDIGGVLGGYTVSWTSAGGISFNRFTLKDEGTGKFDVGRVDLIQGVSSHTPVGGNLFVQDDGPVLSGTTITKAVGEDAMTGAGGGDLSTGNPDAGDTKSDEVSYSYSEISGLVNAGTDSPALTSLTSSFAANTAVRDINNNIIASNGETVFWGVSGGVVQGITATNRVVFTITNDVANSEYDVDLKDQIDHANASGDEAITTLNLTPAFQATDKDLDPVTLTGNLVKLDVENDVPIQNNALVAGTVDEDGVIENVAVGTQTGDGIAGGPAGAGSFADFAGEPVTATGSIASLFTVGADEPLTYSLSTTTSGLPSLNSGGVAVLYSVTGNTLTAYRSGGSPANQADQVFTFSLTNTTTGAYSFTLIDQLDHASLDGLLGDNLENDLLIQLGSILRATDKDGDTITYVPAGDNSNGLVITVDDDTATQNNTLVAGTVDEDGVIENVAVGTQTGDGIAGGVGDVTGEAVTATGSIAGLFNSGADEPLVFGMLATTSGLPSLASGGVAVLYSVTGNTLTAYRSGGSPANQADQVFTFSITNTTTGAYSFTLIDQLDHASLDGLSGDNSENDLLIQLGSILQATDKDGDTITYVPAADNTNGLVITVDDDTGALNGNSVTKHVDEDNLNPADPNDNDLSTGILETNLIDGDSTPGVEQDEVNFSQSDLLGVVNSGADEPVIFGLNLSASGAVNSVNPATGVTSALMSKGQAVTWAVVGGVVQGVTGAGTPGDTSDDRVVFSVTLNPNGAGAADDTFTFNLLDQVDHPNASGDLGLLTLDVTAAFVGSDFDGDAVDLNGAANDQEPIRVEVENDVPKAIANASVSEEVHEDALTGGNTPDAGDSETKVVTVTYTKAELTALANVGADEDLTFSLNTAASGQPGAVIGTNVVTTGGANVQSGGVNVVWAAGAAPGSLIGVISGTATTVFTLTPSGDDFVFTLAEPVDHSGAENDLELLALDLTSAFKAVDFDLDPLTLNPDLVVLNIENDLPIFNGQILSKTLDWVDDGFVTGSLFGKVGADDTASYVIDKFTDLAGYTETLSADGKTLTYSIGGTTFFTLALNDAANMGAGSYTFTVNEPPPQQVLELNFEDLDSGQNLFGTVAFDKTDIDDNGTPGDPSDDFLPDGGLMTFPSNIDINDGQDGEPGPPPLESNDGTMTSQSGSTNTSKGGGPVTIGNTNQAFDSPDEGAWFVYVDNPATTAVSGVGLDPNLADDADNMKFDGTVEVTKASVELVQASGAGTAKRPGPALQVTAYDINPGTIDNSADSRAFALDPTATGDQSNIIGVKIYDANGVLIEYRTNLNNGATNVGAINDTDDPGTGVSGPGGSDNSLVNISFILDDPGGAGTDDDIYSALVSNLKANYTIEWETEGNHDAANVQHVSGSYDIGGFNLLQGQDTADVDFEFSVAVVDKDGDINHFAGTNDVFDDFRIKVDGTGGFNDPANVAPTGFVTSYDVPSDYLI